MSGASMAMPMPGEPSPGGVAALLFSAATFEVSWIGMMAVMMLPSVAPAFRRYHRTVARLREARPGRLTAIAGAAYLAVWGAAGAAVYVVDIGLTSMHAAVPVRFAPLLLGGVVIGAGALQFTAWKARQLGCCSELPPRGRLGAARAGAAWRAGLRFGLHCCGSSIGATAVLLAAGMMDWRAMVVVTAAISAERLAPHGERVARVVGGFAVCGGLVLTALAVGAP